MVLGLIKEKEEIFLQKTEVLNLRDTPDCITFCLAHMADGTEERTESCGLSGSAVFP